MKRKGVYRAAGAQQVTAAMAPALLSRGERVGDGLNLQRWDVIRKIGEGQFAEVYEVADTFDEGKRVALKMDRTLEVKTVRQEQRVLRRLQACPSVVRLLEQGSHEERGFLVMEVTGLRWDLPIHCSGLCGTGCMGRGRGWGGGGGGRRRPAPPRTGFGMRLHCAVLEARCCLYYHLT